MKPCINEATTMTSSFEVDVKTYSEAGFKAIEIWLEKVEKFIAGNSIEVVKKLLEISGLKAVSACSQGGLMLSKGKEREKNLSNFKQRLSLCQKLNVPILVVPTDFPKTVEYSMYNEAVNNLKEVSSIANKYGILLAIEFIQGAKFLGCLSTTIQLIRKVNRENIGVLFDTFHFYVGKSKLEDINEIKKGELFFVHINDAENLPREILTDTNRVLLGRGVIPLKKIIDKLDRIGYDGYASLELFDRKLWNKDPKEVAKEGLKSLKRFL